MKSPVQHPPYLDASSRAAEGKHGANETIHTQPNPTLPQQALPVLCTNSHYSMNVSFKIFEKFVLSL